MKHSIFLFLLNLIFVVVANGQVVLDSNSTKSLIPRTKMFFDDSTFSDSSKPLFYGRSKGDSTLWYASKDSMELTKICDSTIIISNSINHFGSDGVGFLVVGVRFKNLESLGYGLLTTIVDKGSNTFTLTEINQIRPISLNHIVGLTSGVHLTQNGLSFKGSREDGTAYYLDGMRLIFPVIAQSLEDNEIVK